MPHPATHLRHAGVRGLAVSAAAACILPTTFLAPASVSAAPPGYPLVRERDAFYLADFLESGETVKLKVLRPTTVFSTKDATDRVDALRPGQEAELVGFSKFALRVRGQGTNGAVVGWVNPRDVEAAQPGVLDALRQMAERRAQVAKFIAARQVAIGMTTGEVLEARGEPTRRESRFTADGNSQIWEYIDFEVQDHYNYVRDPQTGAVYRQFAYQERIEKGRTSIEFKDGIVTALGEKENNAPRKAFSVVPLPLDLNF